MRSIGGVGGQGVSNQACLFGHLMNSNASLKAYHPQTRLPNSCTAGRLTPVKYKTQPHFTGQAKLPRFLCLYFNLRVFVSSLVRIETLIPSIALISTPCNPWKLAGAKLISEALSACPVECPWHNIPPGCPIPSVLGGLGVLCGEILFNHVNPV